MFKIITSMAIIASQSSLEKRREVTLMMLPDGLLSWRQRRSRRLCRQECHLHNHQRQSRQKKFPSLSSGGLFVINKKAILIILLIKPKYQDLST